MYVYRAFVLNRSKAPKLTGGSNSSEGNGCGADWSAPVDAPCCCASTDPLFSSNGRTLTNELIHGARWRACAYCRVTKAQGRAFPQNGAARFFPAASSPLLSIEWGIPYISRHVLHRGASAQNMTEQQCGEAARKSSTMVWVGTQPCPVRVPRAV